MSSTYCQLATTPFHFERLKLQNSLGGTNIPNAVERKHSVKKKVHIIKDKSLKTEPSLLFLILINIIAILLCCAVNQRHYWLKLNQAFKILGY